MSAATTGKEDGHERILECSHVVFVRSGFADALVLCAAEFPLVEAAGLVTLADKGYQGSAYAKIPYRGKHKPES